MGAAQDHGAGCHDGTFAHHDIVHHHRTHADEGQVFDLGPVDGHIVADGDIVADFYGRFLIEGVQNGTVLDVDVVADADGIDVAAHHGVEPDGTAVAHHHVADDGGVLGQEAVLADLRLEAAHRLD